MTITSISCGTNAGLQQQGVCFFSKGGDVEGELVAQDKVLVVEGRDVEGNLLAQVEVKEGQGWRHVVFLEAGGGISSYMSGVESKRQKRAEAGMEQD